MENNTFQRFVQVKGTEFYYNGKPVIFRGFGVGSWLNLEHFMIGIPSLDGMIRQTFTECYSEYFQLIRSYTAKV